jgi:hypothetical protein
MPELHLRCGFLRAPQGRLGTTPTPPPHSRELHPFVCLLCRRYTPFCYWLANAAGALELHNRITAVCMRSAVSVDVCNAARK